MSQQQPAASAIKQASGFSRWWSKNRNDIVRDSLVALVMGLILLGGAIWWDKQLARRAEIAANVQFVRDSSLSDASELPYADLDLKGATLEHMQLACIDDEGNQDPSRSRHCAIFEGAELEQANLSYSNLTAGRFSGAHMVKVTFNNVRVPRGVFVGADLRRAKLINSNFVRANLREADLRGADLSGSDLSDADLTGAQIDGANFDRVCLSQKTTWPVQSKVPPSTPESCHH